MNRRFQKSGQAGIIVLLLALLVMGYLVWKNHEALIPKSAPGAANAPATQLENFKNEAKKIEEMQNRALPSVNPETPEDSPSARPPIVPEASRRTEGGE